MQKVNGTGSLPTQLARLREPLRIWAIEARVVMPAMGVLTGQAVRDGARWVIRQGPVEASLFATKQAAETAAVEAGTELRRVAADDWGVSLRVTEFVEADADEGPGHD